MVHKVPEIFALFFFEYRQQMTLKVLLYPFYILLIMCLLRIGQDSPKELVWPWQQAPLLGVGG